MRADPFGRGGIFRPGQGLEGPLEIVEDAEQILENVGLGELEVLGLFPVEPLAEVLHLGREPQVFVLELVGLLLELLDLVVFSFELGLERDDFRRGRAAGGPGLGGSFPVRGGAGGLASAGPADGGAAACSDRPEASRSESGVLRRSVLSMS